MLGKTDKLMNLTTLPSSIIQICDEVFSDESDFKGHFTQYHTKNESEKNMKTCSADIVRVKRLWERETAHCFPISFPWSKPDPSAPDPLMEKWSASGYDLDTGASSISH